MEIEHSNDMDNELLFYPICFTTTIGKFFLLWYSDEKQGKDLFLRKDLRVFYSCDLSGLSFFNGKISIDTSNPLVIDCVKIEVLLHKGEVDCVAFLNFWNTIEDLGESVGGAFFTDCLRLNSLYEKLICGNNLPAWKSTPHQYIPLWTLEEIEELKSIFRIGIKLLYECVNHGIFLDTKK